MRHLLEYGDGDELHVFSYFRRPFRHALRCEGHFANATDWQHEAAQRDLAGQGDILAN